MLFFTNLPQRLGANNLEQFTFGNPDAAHDKLIKDAMCVCKIRPIQEFLEDEKPILLGEKAPVRPPSLSCSVRRNFGSNARRRSKKF